MADESQPVPQNVPGQFFVDNTCIYCELCTEIAPRHFAHESEMGWAYISLQPRNAEELKKSREAAGACPTKSIGLRY
jgi:ferredoxin